jgi:hypothetical protein
MQRHNTKHSVKMNAFFHYRSRMPPTVESESSNSHGSRSKSLTTTQQLDVSTDDRAETHEHRDWSLSTFTFRCIDM